MGVRTRHGPTTLDLTASSDVATNSTSADAGADARSPERGESPLNADSSGNCNIVQPQMRREPIEAIG